MKREIQEKTSCHSYFLILSACDILTEKGVVAKEGSVFSPDEISRTLGIQPFKTQMAGEIRKDGCGTYAFSAWHGCRQDAPAMDAEEQCRNIIRELRPHIPQLQTIKEKYRVDFSIQVVPHIYNEENPVIGFDREIIEFCYLTGTEIAVDLYIYDKD